MSEVKVWGAAGSFWGHEAGPGQLLLAGSRSWCPSPTSAPMCACLFSITGLGVALIQDALLPVLPSITPAEATFHARSHAQIWADTSFRATISPSTRSAGRTVPGL